MAENTYQGRLIKRLRKLFPGCVILKNDPNYMQGFPDLTILYRDRWAVLEVKDSETSPVQPNQEYYVKQLNSMSFSTFIYPQNEKAVLDELQHAFQSGWETRVP